ncbi:MAG: leucyl/phenylalanyl-tRNA--protein transferase [Oligoflexia bacterium]|nr:leucyl/phenylalanyl-tRNA--protein transferase [Oligoflexia bacterium]
MAIREFPPVSEADSQGLLALGGDLEVPSLVLAYKSGIFPWPFEAQILTWFAPPRRAVLFLDQFHIPRSLKKSLSKSAWQIRFNTAFDEVIGSCAESKNRRGQAGTWITPDIVEAYKELHRAGYAHSIETWEGARLVGGLYGVAIGKMFAGESMFYRKADASKVAFVRLVEHLKAHGVEWLDCQVMTPHMEALGARTIRRDRFMQLLAEAVSARVKLFE